MLDIRGFLRVPFPISWLMITLSKPSVLDSSPLALINVALRYYQSWFILLPSSELPFFKFYVQILPTLQNLG